MYFTNKWDWEPRGAGQVVTFDDLQNLQLYLRGTDLDLFGDLFRDRGNFASDLPLSGVVKGLGVSASATPMVANIDRGLGLSYNALTDLTGVCGITPVLVKSALASPVIANGGAQPRRDIIVANFTPAYPFGLASDVAARAVRLPTGVLTTQNLPGRMVMTATISVLPGTPGVFAPADVASVSPVDLPLAVVYIPAGVGPVILGTAGTTITDVRPFLRHRLGGSSVYEAVGIAAGGAGALSHVHQHVTAPDIDVTGLLALAGGVHGNEYTATLQWPIWQYPDYIAAHNNVPITMFAQVSHVADVLDILNPVAVKTHATMSSAHGGTKAQAIIHALIWNEAAPHVPLVLPNGYSLNLRVQIPSRL